jgi:hypothetical protein
VQAFDPNSPQLRLAAGILAVGFLLTSAFLWLSKNASLKRRVFPFLAVLLGALFLAIPVVAGFPLDSLYTFGPLVAVGVWLNIRAFQFCQTCGNTVRGGAYLSRPKFCPKCGAGLKQ